MEFIVDKFETLNVSDDEIFNLLTQVYVQAGYASAEVAKTAFDPLRVRKRGQLFIAKELSEQIFAGMVIVVSPDSQASVRAKGNECEMHLLGVNPKYRGYGLGRRLVMQAIKFAIERHYSKMILWTQKPMKQAQKLYESVGFVKAGEMERNGIEFYVYEKSLNLP